MSTEKPKTEPVRFRQPKGKIKGILLKALLSAISVVCLGYALDALSYFRIAVFKQQFFGLIYGLVLAAGFIIFPATANSPRDRVPWYDTIFALLGLAGGLYVCFVYPKIVHTLGIITMDKVILGGITLLVILEMSRRIYGWPLVILAALFILYAHFAYIVPGILGGRGFSWQRLASFLYLDTGSILGFVAMVVYGMVFCFIFFGKALFATGGGKFFTDVSLAIMGKRKGGPAKVAVVASALFGTLSGSASSDVVITGAITIPMMKKTGYRAHVAAAIEAVASSGGALVPPVMGATAFIIAELLAIPYREIVIAAVVPAILYYTTVFLHVDLEAKKRGMSGLPADQIPSLKDSLFQGWVYVIPMMALIYFLFVLYISPGKSALFALAFLVIVSLFKSEARFTPKKFLDCLEDTGRLMVQIGIICAMAGIIIGVVSLTGIGFVFSQVLINISGGNVYLLLLFTAFAAVALGMGMPITASYIILAVLAAPALVKIGVPPLAAHLFVFYFALLSFITPPVCVAVYIASPIASSEPMRTAFEAMKIGAIAYIVPFIFVTRPALLLMGSLQEIVLVIPACMIGFITLVIAIRGYLFFELSLRMRCLFGIGAVLMLMNYWLSNVVGLVLLGSLFFWNWRTKNSMALQS